jgi:hypothetical protein
MHGCTDNDMRRPLSPNRDEGSTYQRFSWVDGLSQLQFQFNKPFQYRKEPSSLAPLRSSRGITTRFNGAPYFTRHIFTP